MGIFCSGTNGQVSSLIAKETVYQNLYDQMVAHGRTNKEHPLPYCLYLIDPNSGSVI